MKRYRVACAAAFLVALIAVCALAAPRGKGGRARREKQDAGVGDKLAKISLNKAVEVKIPALADDLKPKVFQTADGKRGWAIKIPGERPIATPAYADGTIFVGGGYGSHEFYAFDAETGALRWKMKTSDDGPSAAVVEDGFVAFNTESCTLVVADAKTGKVVWEQWLGDPLMSQPAISKGRVYMAYPSGQRGGGVGAANHISQSAKLNHHLHPAPQQAATQEQNGAAQEPKGSHKLLCADLKTGQHIWEQTITADVISAPIVSGEQIYFTCFDGTSYSLNARDGSIAWKKENAGTSAPVVAAGQVVLTQKEQRGDKSYEGLKQLDAKAGTDKDDKLLAGEKAAYLDENKGGGVALGEAAQAILDSSVGFGNAPAAAQLGTANRHIGVRTVAGGWAYQGSRAAYSRGRMLNAQGKYLNSINASDGRFAWRAEVSGAGLGADAQVFSPPALGDQYMYLSSSLGHILSVRQRDGEVGFMYSFGQPMVFQPALADGNVYVGTSNGLLICLKTGETDADGWYAWGGNAEHNKTEHGKKNN
ncbi:MAG TPA: PQQ-binding-like beta-propeller repeat protein [Pyrinomonadaceae bacterium]|nr:PQQ-binding-like beta-propeller repeat protein [Pyrinomonadaceae bacterium]